MTLVGSGSEADGITLDQFYQMHTMLTRRSLAINLVLSSSVCTVYSMDMYIYQSSQATGGGKDSLIELDSLCMSEAQPSQYGVGTEY